MSDEDLKEYDDWGNDKNWEYCDWIDLDNNITLTVLNKQVDIDKHWVSPLSKKTNINTSCYMNMVNFYNEIDLDEPEIVESNKYARINAFKDVAKVLTQTEINKNRRDRRL
jgi:hypothetical protein